MRVIILNAMLTGSSLQIHFVSGHGKDNSRQRKGVYPHQGGLHGEGTTFEVELPPSR
jgi:hypothetical protein